MTTFVTPRFTWPLERPSSHLGASPLSEELRHHQIQLSEPAEGAGDVPVQVLVLLVLVVEDGGVGFPLLRAADLRVFSNGDGCVTDAAVVLLLLLVLGLHEVVCNHVHSGGTFRGLGSRSRSRLARAGVPFIPEGQVLCLQGGQRDGRLKVLLGLNDQRRTKKIRVLAELQHPAAR